MCRNKQKDKIMNPTIEAHLKELGFFPAVLTEALEELVDLRNVYSEKGYFNDPRDEYGEVAF